MGQTVLAKVIKNSTHYHYIKLPYSFRNQSVEVWSYDQNKGINTIAVPSGGSARVSLGADPFIEGEIVKVTYSAPAAQITHIKKTLSTS